MNIFSWRQQVDIGVIECISVNNLVLLSVRFYDDRVVFRDMRLDVIGHWIRLIKHVPQFGKVPQLVLTICQLIQAFRKKMLRPFCDDFEYCSKWWPHGTHLFGRLQSKYQWTQEIYHSQLTVPLPFGDGTFHSCCMFNLDASCYR